MQGIKFNQQAVKAINDGLKVMTRRPIKGITIQHDLGIAGQELGEREIYNPENGEISYAFSIGYEDEEKYEESVVRIVPKYKLGETVFVQEMFIEGHEVGFDGNFKMDDNGSAIPKIWYKADNDLDTWLDEWDCDVDVPWIAASEMQEYQARTFRKIKFIKVERLQDISEEDCIKEGVRLIEETHSCEGVCSDFFFCTGTPNYSTEDNMYYDEYYPRENSSVCFENEIWNDLPYEKPYDWDSNPYVSVYEFEKVNR